jgi:hypothetical protein
MTSVGIMASGMNLSSGYTGPTFVAVGSVNYSAAAGASISAPLPVGWSIGQLGMAIVYNDDGTLADATDTNVAWAGHDSRGTTPTTARPVYAYLKYLASGEPAPVFNFSSGSPTDRHAYMLTFAPPIQISVLADYYSGSTNIPSATPTDRTVATDNSLLVQVVAAEFYGSLRMSSSNGFTSLATSGTANGAGSTMVVAKQVNAGVQSFPTYTWGTGANNSKISCMTFVLAPV